MTARASRAGRPAGVCREFAEPGVAFARWMSGHRRGAGPCPARRDRCSDRRRAKAIALADAMGISRPARGPPAVRQPAVAGRRASAEAVALADQAEPLVHPGWNGSCWASRGCAPARGRRAIRPGRGAVRVALAAPFADRLLRPNSRDSRAAGAGELGPAPAAGRTGGSASVALQRRARGRCADGAARRECDRRPRRSRQPGRRARPSRGRSRCRRSRHST